jgi:predicted amidohydrolase
MKRSLPRVFGGRNRDQSAHMKGQSMLVLPEVQLVLAMFSQLRRRVAADPERGEVVQWVLLAAIGATMAITVGAIILAKMTDKANQISTTTP